MSVIGFYDLDLWHCRTRHLPNLELMKMSNYHYNKGDKVVMVKPKDEERRFDKIVYFQDNNHTIVPRDLMMYGQNKQIYGYGFFNKFYPLDDIYYDVPPSYFLYEPFEEKMFKEKYKSIKNNSLIRVENSDFSDFKKDKKKIYIVDHNFASLSNSLNFLEDFSSKGYQFNFLHPLNIISDEQCIQMGKYASQFANHLFINYNFSKDVIEEYYPYLSFNLNKYSSDNKDGLYNKVITLILFYKSKGCSVQLRLQDSKKDQFLQYILQWNSQFIKESYYEHYKNNKEAIDLANKAASNIRLLLKTNPQKVKSSNLDFHFIK